MKRILILIACLISIPAFGQTLSGTELVLTGGTTYANGNYLSTFTNGVLTWTPYTPTPGPQGPTGPQGPQGPAGTSTVIGTSVSEVAGTLQPFAATSSTYTLSGVPAPGTPALIFLNPSLDLGPCITYRARVTAANTVVVTWQNTVAAPISVPAYTLYISAVH